MRIRQFVLWAVGLACMVIGSVNAQADPIVVNCDQGQSLNRTLARMNKATPATVLVKGTCVEYVRVRGFDGLTLKGSLGATLVQPNVAPANNILTAVLLIEASRSVTVDGFKFQSPTAGVSGIGVGQGSSDIRLRNLTVEGGVIGIIIFENSQVSLARIIGRDPGYSPLGIYDTSDVHVEDCLFEHSTGELWHVGIDVGSGHLTIHGTTIRNMQVGMNARDGGEIEVYDFNTYYPSGEHSEVLIENPAGTNFYGVDVTEGSSLGVGAKLRITNAGQPWGGDTAGVHVSNGSTLNAWGNLLVSGSQGHGVFVTRNSHASFDGSHITGSQHGGLVVVNLSTIGVGSLTPPTEISGNGTDLFCDSKSLITGGANIVNATSVQCSSLLPGDYENLP